MSDVRPPTVTAVTRMIHEVKAWPTARKEGLNVVSDDILNALGGHPGLRLVWMRADSAKHLTDEQRDAAMSRLSDRLCERGWQVSQADDGLRVIALPS